MEKEIKEVAHKTCEQIHKGLLVLCLCGMTQDLLKARVSMTRALCLSKDSDCSLCCEHRHSGTKICEQSLQEAPNPKYPFAPNCLLPVIMALYSERGDRALNSCENGWMRIPCVVTLFSPAVFRNTGYHHVFPRNLRCLRCTGTLPISQVGLLPKTLADLILFYIKRQFFCSTVCFALYLTWNTSTAFSFQFIKSTLSRCHIVGSRSSWTSRIPTEQAS